MDDDEGQAEVNFPEPTYDQRPPDRERDLTLLIVDDAEEGRLRIEAVCRSLSSVQNVRVLTSASLPDAFSVLQSTSVDVVLLDKNVGPDESDPAQDGIEAIPQMLSLHPQLQILMVTGSKLTDDIVTAMQNGAFGYVTKDSDDKIIIAQIEKAVLVANLLRQKEIAGRSQDDLEIVGRSIVIREVYRDAKEYAVSGRPVLIIGETGTGKTTIARLMHGYRKKYLKQSERPFLALNVSAIPSQVVEAELFGTEPGAFTGAIRKQGFVELADAGTLFLDEIGDVSLEVQVKLLKAIDEGIFFRVGGKKELKSHFKLICATHRDLKAMVAQGTFREDLYFRISTFVIKMPSLSERREDIPDIIRAVLPKCGKDNHVHVRFENLPEDFIHHLTNVIPEGNIRGIERELSLLLVKSPKAKNGLPVFKKWRSIFTKEAVESSGSRLGALTLGDLMALPLDIIRPDFPGFTEFVDLMKDCVFIAAHERMKKNKDIAKFLKLSESAVSTRLNELRRLGKITEEDKVMAFSLGLTSSGAMGSGGFHDR